LRVPQLYISEILLLAAEECISIVGEAYKVTVIQVPVIEEVPVSEAVKVHEITKAAIYANTPATRYDADTRSIEDVIEVVKVINVIEPTKVKVVNVVVAVAKVKVVCHGGCGDHHHHRCH